MENTTVIANLSSLHAAWGMPAVIGLSSVLILFIIISSIGNMLVMVSLASNRHQCNRGYIFLFNLALIDFLTSVCCMPISLSTLLRGEFSFSSGVCDFNALTTEIFFAANIHTLMYMAVYRYTSLSEPFSRQKTSVWKIWVMVVASWLWGLLIGSLAYLVVGDYLWKPNTTQCGPGYPKTINGWAIFALVASTCFVIPLFVMLFMYIAVFVKAFNLYKRMKDPGYSNHARKAQAQHRYLSVTFIVIVVAFIISWGPLFCYLVYVTIEKDKEDIPVLINPIVYWLGYMNSVLNPIIYSVRTPIFRQLVRQFCYKKSANLYASPDTLSDDRQKSHDSLNQMVTKVKIVSKDSAGNPIEV